MRLDDDIVNNSTLYSYTVVDFEVPIKQRIDVYI
jgi:hypothetical protein